MTDSRSFRPAFDTFDHGVAEMMSTTAGATGGIPEYLGIRTVEVGPGTMTAELDVRPELLNPFGPAHSGTLAALPDHVLGAVLYLLIPRGAWGATTELKLNLLAPVRSGVLQARSEVISLTRRTAVVRMDATNDGAPRWRRTGDRHDHRPESRPLTPPVCRLVDHRETLPCSAGLMPGTSLAAIKSTVATTALRTVVGEPADEVPADLADVAHGSRGHDANPRRIK